MKTIEIYDPALCCSTGICGPGVDPELVRIAADLDMLSKKGGDVKRYNLSQDPGAFAANTAVMELLKDKGPDILPVTLVDGEVKKEQGYPSAKELGEWTGISLALPAVGKKPLKLLDTASQSSAGGGCTPGSGCC